MTELRLAVGTDQTTAGADAVLRALDGRRVVVRVAAGLDPLAASAAAALISMLGRMHAHVDVDGDAVCGPNPWAATTVTDVLGRIAAQRPISVADPAADLVVAVGGPSGDICLGGDDWTAHIGPDPVAASGARTGLGLHAAAAFGAAEVLKRVLGPLGMVSVQAEFTWDLSTYRLRPAPPPELFGQPVPLLLAGAGSVNSSAAAQLMGLTIPGTAVVVDPDCFDAARNPYRYPAATDATDGPKSTWVARMLSVAGWNATGLDVDVAGWVARSPPRDSTASWSVRWTRSRAAPTSRTCWPAQL